MDALKASLKEEYEKQIQERIEQGHETARNLSEAMRNLRSTHRAERAGLKEEISSKENRISELQASLD